MDTPNTIAVNVRTERKVHASGADMHIEIKGDSVVSGRTALKKAREVRDLVAALAGIGVQADHVQVAGVRAEVTSGLIGKTSSALYRLRVEIASLDVLADALGAVTSRKNATLIGLEWRYDRADELHDELLADALQIAQTRTALICRGLSHRNVGVHTLTEKLRHEDREAYPHSRAFSLSDSFDAASGEAVTKEDLGLDVSHTKTIALDLRVEFLVEPELEAE